MKLFLPLLLVATPALAEPPANVTMANGQPRAVTPMSLTPGSLMATGQVAVGTTATLVASARPARQRITVTVTTAVACAYGNAGVTLATGYLLPAVAGASDTTDTSAALYAVCTSAAVVGYKEIY